MPYETREDFESELDALCRDFITARREHDQEMEDLQEEYNEAVQAVTDKERAIAAAEEGIDCSDHRRAEAARYDEMVAAADANLAALDAEREARRALSDLRADIAEVEAHIEGVETEITTVEADIDEREEALAPDTSDPELEAQRDTLAELKAARTELKADLIHLQAQLPGVEAEVAAAEAAVMEAQEKLGAAERAYEAAADALEECEERETDDESDDGGESLEDLQQRRDELKPHSGSEWVERSEAVKDAQWDAYSDWEELFNKAEEHAELYDWDSFERCEVPAEE